MSCTICETRKEKRFCLALHARICSPCCGEQREVTLDCPSECPYLQQARRHETPLSADYLQEAELFLDLKIEDQFLYEREPLLAGLMYALCQRSADRDVKDRDLIAVLTSMAKNHHMLISSGLHYQAATTNIMQQAIADELRAVLKEFQEAEHRHMGYSTLRDSDILKALVFLLRLAHTHTSGRPKSRAFIDFVREQFSEKTSPITASQDAGTRIILP